jgi:hypothetical protein
MARMRAVFAENIVEYLFGSSWKRLLSFDALLFQLIAQEIRSSTTHRAAVHDALMRGVLCTLTYLMGQWQRNATLQLMQTTVWMWMERHRMARTLP